jgi:hypothetical protein
MATTELLTSLFQLYCIPNLLKKEKCLLETIFFVYLYQELLIHFEEQTAKDQSVEEESMLDGYVIRQLIHDLISSEDYSIPGIACYTGFPEDVIFDLASGVNAHPSLSFARKIVELHAMARREFYSKLIPKVWSKVKSAN